MATTLQADSFSTTNIRERTLLAGDAQPSDNTLTVDSTHGINPGDFIYLGDLSRDGCEKATVQAVPSSTTLTLASPTSLPHSASQPVTSVLGDMIHIYRAANIDGSVPADDAFSVLATREIDADQTSTYFTDSTGSSDWWYKMTYYNAVANVETALADSPAVRGSDFGHYCSLSEIRTEAGFDNAFNLKDSSIDQQRRAAEAEINSTLRSAYTVPFIKPVPQRVRYLTIKLAAGFLLQKAYAGQSSRGDSVVKDIREQLRGLQDGTDVLDDDTVTPYDGNGVSSWPNDTTAGADADLGGGGRSFQTGDIY